MRTVVRLPLFAILAAASLLPAPAGERGGVADAAPRQPEPRRYTNEDLPERPVVSVIGSPGPAPSLAELLSMLPPPPESAPPLARAAGSDESSADRSDAARDRFVPPGRLLELIGARGQACLYGRCPDGTPPLRATPPWSGESARRSVRERWSRPAQAPAGPSRDAGGGS
ncbi:MAG: hypothetical protein D6738_02440 [Acidobacteria bacterium]|nr:MAG: hypothetical protein D6738_02440 [Acidobacteriota bacterium]